MKKYYAFAGLLLIGMLAVYGVTSKSGWFHMGSEHAEPETYRVAVSDTGFAPAHLRILVGDTVTFTNVGTTGHWPASDAHPSHDIYPEFDPKRSLAPGEEWSFTFTKQGVWRMHDHENAIQEGSITVVDHTHEGETLGAILGDAPDHDTRSEPCPASSTDFHCYEEYYRGLVETEGVTPAMTALKEAYASSDYIRSQCHPLTHVIGRAATRVYPRVSEAYAHGDVLCWSGYYHGVMEGIIGTIGRADIEAQIDTICADIPTKASHSFDYYNCIHGLGHGLMALTQNELFESLTLCDRLTGSWEQSSCYGGVFMENVIVDNKNHFTKYLKPDDPVYPCNAVESQHKQSCYLMQTSYMLKVHHQDFSKVFPLCRTVDAGYDATCFQSLGRDASGSTVSDIERTKAICDGGANNFEQSNCLIGAVKDFISYYHSDKEAKQLCERYAPELKDTCLATTESYYQAF